MKNEELEQSLRVEFETYFKGVLTEMNQEVFDFRKKIDSEFERHKSQLKELAQSFSETLKKEYEIEKSLSESIAEHLKLARDEGATITAVAYEEAEELRKESNTPTNFSDIRDGINEISGKNTQSEVLKSLVRQSSKYTPRGAFFIVKNKHLVGWKFFGMEKRLEPEVIRDVFFSLSSETILNESISTLGTVSSSFGTYENDSDYLKKMEFGEPEKMHAVPLVVRGKGVAALYVDNGSGDTEVNVEAIEMLVRAAGLTVEILASMPLKSKADETQVHDETTDEEVEVSEKPVFKSKKGRPKVSHKGTFSESKEVKLVDLDEEMPSHDSVSMGNEFVEGKAHYDVSSQPQTKVSSTKASSLEQEASSETGFEITSQNQTEVETVNKEELVPEITYEEETISVTDYEYSSAEEHQTDVKQPYETEIPVKVAETPQGEFVEPESPRFDGGKVEETEHFHYVKEVPGVPESENDQAESSFESVEKDTPQKEESSFPTSFKPRFGDKNVELPIEVAENERRYHNDARRFARLLVSEIKLYNEQKVREGRESSDLYERLREAIERSREMYEKRVQPPVASKFDYFNYELVNTLAEGDKTRLGENYPGATV